MNNLMLVALAVVVLCYWGGKYCPKVLSSNKEVVLGVLVGMALCSFAGLRLEGLSIGEPCNTTEECDEEAVCFSKSEGDRKICTDPVDYERSNCIAQRSMMCVGSDEEEPPVNVQWFNRLCCGVDVSCPGHKCPEREDGE